MRPLSMDIDKKKLMKKINDLKYVNAANAVIY